MDDDAETAGLLAALATPEQPAATFRALEQALATLPGYLLFTVLVHDPVHALQQRYWSNLPDSYPVGGRKPVVDSPWARQVIHAGQPYIGRSAADIRAVFNDHRLIGSLGCESVLNMPVRWDGQTLGTVNLLHRAGYYDGHHLARVRLLAHLAAPAFLEVVWA